MVNPAKDSESEAESLSKNAGRHFSALQPGETMTFEMEVQEDIPAELEAFVKLARLELFQEAESWFDKCLLPHRHMFPILVEYADMLLQRGSYSKLVGTLNDIDPSSLIALGETSMSDAMDLLQFMMTFANPRLNGELDEVMPCAIKCWDRLNERSTSLAPHLSTAHVHMIEIYLRILLTAFKLDSTLLHGKEKYTNPPWTALESPRWSGFCELYTTLKGNGSHWEAQRLQSMLLPVVSFEDVMGTFIRGDQFDAVAADIDACQINPSVVLTELIISNRICNYLLEREPLLIIISEAFLNASRSLKRVLCENSRLGNTEQARPFLQVNELEELLPRVVQAPMSYAAGKGHGRVIQLLIEKGLDIEATDSSGRSSLSYAAEKGHNDVMGLLMEKGADIETKDSSGRSPLSWAAGNGHENAVRLLLDRGADSNTQDRFGRSPLSWATENGHRNVIRLLTLLPQVGKQSSSLQPSNAPVFHRLNTKWLVPWAKEGVRVESLKFSTESGESFRGCDISPGLDSFALWTDNKIVVCRAAFLRAEGNRGNGATVRSLAPIVNGGGRLLNSVSLTQKYCATVWNLPPNVTSGGRMLNSVSLKRRYLIASTTGNFQYYIFDMQRHGLKNPCLVAHSHLPEISRLAVSPSSDDFFFILRGNSENPNSGTFCYAQVNSPEICRKLFRLNCSVTDLIHTVFPSDDTVHYVFRSDKNDQDHEMTIINAGIQGKASQLGSLVIDLKVGADHLSMSQWARTLSPVHGDPSTYIFIIGRKLYLKERLRASPRQFDIKSHFVSQVVATQENRTVLAVGRPLASPRMFLLALNIPTRKRQQTTLEVTELAGLPGLSPDHAFRARYSEEHGKKVVLIVCFEADSNFEHSMFRIELPARDLNS